MSGIAKRCHVILSSCACTQHPAAVARPLHLRAATTSFQVWCSVPFGFRGKERVYFRRHTSFFFLAAHKTAQRSIFFSALGMCETTPTATTTKQRENSADRLTFAQKRRKTQKDAHCLPLSVKAHLLAGLVFLLATLNLTFPADWSASGRRGCDCVPECHQCLWGH